MDEHDVGTTRPKLKIGDPIKFASRKGKVIGYWIGRRNSNDSLGYYYVVELDSRSSGYVTDTTNSKKDMFVSVCLVHIGNED